MKPLNFLAFVILAPATAFTFSYDNYESAVRLQNSLTPSVMSMPGVWGIEIIRCDSRTAAPTNSDIGSESCIAILFEKNNIATYRQLIWRFPAKHKLQNIFVDLFPAGKFEPNPRISGGN